MYILKIRFYTKAESLERLKKMFDFYQEFSRIFPNYTIIEQSKYIYKNIQKKQKVLDNLEEEEEKLHKKKFNLKNIKKIQIIDTENYESIMKVNNSNESFINKNLDNSKDSYKDDINDSFELLTFIIDS